MCVLHGWLLLTVVPHDAPAIGPGASSLPATRVRTIEAQPPAATVAGAAPVVAAPAAPADAAAATGIARPRPIARPADPAAQPSSAPAALPSAATPASASAGAEEATASASAPSAPPAASALPQYRTILPPAFDARFGMRRGLLSGRATLSLETNAERYRLLLRTFVLGREVTHMRSEGQAGVAGLLPVRFVEGRRGRDQRAVNFQRDGPGAARISFSASAAERPLADGTQDRLSWLVQLAAIVEAEPALREPGRQIRLWVVGPRGDADIWTFDVEGPVPAGAAGDAPTRPALALRRAPERAWDTEVRVWLDPVERHLPLRAVWQPNVEESREPGVAAVELWRESITWR